MATKRITAAVVDEMLPGDVVWDAEVRGFGAGIAQGIGRLSWRLGSEACRGS